MFLYGYGRIGRAVGRRLSGNLQSHSIARVDKIVKIVGIDFHHTALIAFPAVQAAHGAKVGKHISPVKLRHVGFIDAPDLETPGFHGLFKKIGKDTVAHLQLQVIGLLARDDDAVRCGRIRLRQTALHHAAVQKGSIVVFAHAFVHRCKVEGSLPQAESAA